MTATVPEDLQISLGKLAVTGTPTALVTESTFASNSLANSTGILYAAENSVAGDSNAAAPSNNAWDWSNSADISAYYDFGRLIPASSTTGENIFYTPDAAGVGKTVKPTASYYQASKGLIAFATDDHTQTATSSTIGNTSSKATLHAYTSAADKSGDNSWKSATYSQAANWKTTNDDGYYVDIPVWIRTSSNSAVDLSVDGYVLPGSLNTGDDASNKVTDLELYRAVRVAILDGEDVAADSSTGALQAGAGKPAAGTYVADASNVANIIPLKDAWDTAKNGDGGTAVATEAVATTQYTKSLFSIFTKEQKSDIIEIEVRKHEKYISK